MAAKAYPHIFAFAGLTDPRVTYWEPAKWIARLRHLNTSDNLILLKTNMEAGHGGASGRFEALEGAGDRLRLRAEDHRPGRRLRRAALPMCRTCGTLGCVGAAATWAKRA